MKNTIFFKGIFCILLSWAAISLNAQSLEQRIKNYTAPLDKSYTQTGLLIHQAPIFMNPEIYNGVNVADTVKGNLTNWGLMYAQLLCASTSTPFLPDSKVYMKTCLKPLVADQAIPLMLMAAQFDYIRPTAISENLIYNENGQLHDVVGRTKSPYNQDTTFLFTPLYKSSISKNVKYVLPDSLLFKNLAANIQAIECQLCNFS